MTHAFEEPVERGRDSAILPAAVRRVSLLTEYTYV